MAEASPTRRSVTRGVIRPYRWPVATGGHSTHHSQHRVRVAFMKWELRVRPDSWPFRIGLGVIFGVLLFGALALVAPLAIAVSGGLTMAIVGPVIVDQQLRAIPPDAVAAQNARIATRIHELEDQDNPGSSSVEPARRSPLRPWVVIIVLAALGGSILLGTQGFLGTAGAILIAVVAMAVMVKAGPRPPLPSQPVPRTHHHDQD